MISMTVFIKSFLLAVIMTLYLIPETSQCDTKWIRTVYMMTCGKKKRDNPVASLTLPPRFPAGSSRHEPMGRLLLRAILGTDVTTERNKISTTRPPFRPVAFAGMRDVDLMWIMEDLIAEDDSDHHRREISQLLEKCCRIPPISTCSAKDFAGAC